jgi:two-component system, NtrC family, sensor kinase
MRGPPGLRIQLVGGLAIIFLVATVSVGAITRWGMRTQLVDLQLQNGRVFGESVALLVAGALRGGTDRVALERMVGTLSSSITVQALDIVGVDRRVLASSRHPAGQRIDGVDINTVLRTEFARVEVAGAGGAGSTLPTRRLLVTAPILVDGKIRGVVRLDTWIDEQQFSWSRLFWVLMAVDGVLLLLFVAYVLTIYVIRPVEAMQLAASQVTAGDLTARLPEQGARELASLASSFNAMTSSVASQLERLEAQRGELAASREHLIRSEKLASVGRLAAGVAHEVGNPLQAIIGFTEVLQGKDLEPAQRDDFLQRVRGETERIHRIIGGLLDFARPVEDAIEPVDLASVVEQSLQLVGPQRRLRDVEVIQHVQGLPAVAASGSRLVQVLVNLLLNAADAMESRGRITIEGVDNGDLVELRVSNNGPQIPAEHRGRIFDPFFTTKEPGQGTGLGLSVAQSIIESYGGRLTLADEGAETTFVLSLRRFSPAAGST